MSTPKVIVSARAVERIRAGHLWVYRADVLEADSPGDPGPGSVVSVYDRKERFHGKAFFSSSSQITLRILSRDDTEIDRNFWLERLQRAWQLRQRVVRESEVYRVVHAEGDGIPSVIVDRYGKTLCLQTLSQGAERFKSLFAEVLMELFAPDAIVERNDSKVRTLEGLSQQVSLLHGPDPGELVCSENGFQFYYQPLTGQKTGAFLDQRENRAWASKLAFGKALDCFCYAGGFAVHIAEACDEVEAIDISEAALNLGQRNAELNGIRKIRFEAANVFDRLRLYDHLKKRFDTIILDPPAFARSRSQVDSALRGYKELNLRALRLLGPGGILITASCSQLIDDNTFLNVLSQAAADSKRKVQVIQKRTQSQDHPFLLVMPETYYLKCIFLRMIE